MFSYPAGILQTSGAKRAENQFNGAVESSSGKIHVETAASAVTRGAAERQGRAETSNLTAPSAQTTRTARTRAARHQRIQAVQGMKLKIRVPRKAVTSRQHSASSPPHPVRRRIFATSILSLSDAAE